MSSKKKDNNKILIIVIIAAAVILLAINYLNQEPQTSSLESTCASYGGTWVEGYNECEWISEDKCTELGGSFNECDSACRHEEGLVPCTMNCVQVCKF
jgi:hypothetical protein